VKAVHLSVASKKGVAGTRNALPETWEIPMLGFKSKPRMTGMPVMPSLPIVADSTTLPSSVTPTTEHTPLTLA